MRKIKPIANMIFERAIIIGKKQITDTWNKANNIKSNNFLKRNEEKSNIRINNNNIFFSYFECTNNIFANCKVSH